MAAFLLILGLVQGVTLQSASAQASQVRLETIYRGWASAMETKNYRQWKTYTAESRQVETYNTVISRKDKWPDSIFNLPFRLPEISTLTFLDILELGDTANMVFFGRVDFGVMKETEIPQNLLVLKFVRESDGKWKYDNSRFFNLKDNPEVLQMARIRDTSFLQDERFQPTGVVPETPEMLKSPDYVGELWIASVGYETTVTIDDLHQSSVVNNGITDLILGGLLREGREIKVQSREVPIPQDVERRLEVGVYALRPEDSAIRVWHYKPEASELPGTFESKVYANAVTIPGG